MDVDDDGGMEVESGRIGEQASERAKLKGKKMEEGEEEVERHV